MKTYQIYSKFYGNMEMYKRFAQIFCIIYLQSQSKAHGLLFKKTILEK